MKLDVENIKKLREETGAGVLDVKKELEESGGDYKKAKEALMKKGLAKAEKKVDRETNDGLIHSYIHAGGKVGSLVYVSCETDFVAKTEDFKTLCHEIALQVAVDDYDSVEDLLHSEYVRDGSKKIEDLVRETIAKLGENIEIKEFSRLSVN
jgi:elongation factor Ts